MTQARDALICLELFSEREIYAELRGLVLGIRDHGRLIFFDFQDSTSSLQLMATHDDLGDDGLRRTQLVKPTDRISAVGVMTRSRNGTPTLRVQRPPESLISLHDEMGGLANVQEFDRVGVRLFLARLRYKAETFFRESGFLQIEPNFISTSWAHSGIEPLRVHYEGFGVPTFLTPSPSPQILAAMAATGAPRVFAVGRCFTTTYRDETTSAESLILTAMTLHAELDELVALMQDALASTLGDPETMPENYDRLMGGGWLQVPVSWPPSPDGLPVESPTIQIFELPHVDVELGSGVTARRLDAIRACWPHRHVVAEGSVRHLSTRASLGTLSVHLERMVPLLKDVPLRTLSDLQRASE